MPYKINVGQAIFTESGLFAGWQGEPRSYLDADYSGARDSAAREIEVIVGGDPDWEETYTDAQNFSELGETFGPLPDNYAVEVIPVCWNWVIAVAQDAGVDTDAVHADAPSGLGDVFIINAYNEKVTP